MNTDQKRGTRCTFFIVLQTRSHSLVSKYNPEAERPGCEDADQEADEVLVQNRGTICPNCQSFRGLLRRSPPILPFWILPCSLFIINSNSMLEMLWRQHHHLCHVISTCCRCVLTFLCSSLCSVTPLQTHSHFFGHTGIFGHVYRMLFIWRLFIWSLTGHGWKQLKSLFIFWLTFSQFWLKVF